MKNAEEENKKKGNGPYYYVLRKAIWQTFKGLFLKSAFASLLENICAMLYTGSLVTLIGYIGNPDETIKDGLIYLGIFSMFMIGASVFRNLFIFSGYIFSVNLRKVMISAVYEKVTRLSTKSITETNSGKLITIVSGDI